MRVRNYKINTAGNDKEISIPIHMNFQPVDQAEVVEMDFVEKEIEEAISVARDYVWTIVLEEQGAAAQEMLDTVLAALGR